MARGNAGQAYKRGGVGGVLAEVGGHSGEEIPLVDCIEDLEHAGYFEGAMLRCRLRRRPQRDFVEAEIRAGQLAIIRSGIVSRLAVERARILFTPQRFRRATLPVEGAR